MKTLPASASLAPVPLLSVMSVREVFALFENAALVGVATFLERHVQLLCVSGHVTSLGNRGHSVQFQVALSSESRTIYLDVPLELLDAADVRAGHYVEVRGAPQVQRSTDQFRAVELRLRVYELRHAVAPAEIQRRRVEALTLERVRGLENHKHPFPLKRQLRLVLICGNTSKVVPDFTNALGRAADVIRMETVKVALNDASALARAIDAARADIVVLVRGGGKEEQFAVFNQLEVLQAAARQMAYRVIGLGHSQDVTALDLVVDHSATTPATAGHFIAAQIADVLAIEDQVNRGAALHTRNLLDGKERAHAEERKSAERLIEQLRGTRRLAVLLAVGFLAALVMTILGRQ